MTSTSRSLKAVVLLGGGVAAGVIAASAYGATAASTTAGVPSTGSTTSSTGTAPRAPHGDETTVTGSKAATLKAAALAKVPGATVDRIETDSGPAAYEVHLTKADGTHAVLTFDSSLKYLATETGGPGGPGGHRGHDGPGGPGGPGGHNEAAVTGTKAATLKAAALAKVPGAKVDAVEVDSGDAAYEVHLTKADGSEVTVKFDKNLTYVSTESGHGK